MQTNEIISELIDRINSYEIEGESFEAVFAFNGTVSPVPIDRTYIAFSTDSTAVDFFEDDNEQTCKRTRVTIAVDFYFSPKRHAKDICALCETVMDRLMVEYAGRMRDWKAGELKIDDNLRLVRLPCRMSFIFTQCPAFSPGGESILPFADFMCRTHVADGSVHLSPEEKAFVSRPFVTGSYTGNGEGSKTVALGFAPSGVLVCRGSSAGFGYSYGSLASFFGFAAGSRATKGLALGQNGFTVVSGSDVTADGITVKLNAMAQTYFYIAW